MIKCNKCGTQNKDGSRFCSNCGNDLNSNVNSNINNTNNKSSEKVLFCILAFFFPIIGIIVGLYLNISIVPFCIFIIAIHVIYKKKLNKKRVDYVFHSTQYGDCVSSFLGAQSINVDFDRNMVPISGTMIRNDLNSYREFLSDYIFDEYSNFLIKNNENK